MNVSYKKPALAILFATALLVLAATLAGCKASDEVPPTREAASAQHGSTKIELGTENIARQAKAIRDFPLCPPPVVAMANEILANVDIVNAGNTEARKANKKLADDADSSKQPFYRRIDWIILLSGGAFAIGVALLVVAIANGGKTTAGMGFIALGGSGMLTFMLVRGLSTALAWAAPGVGIVITAAFAYFVYERFKAAKQRRERESKLMRTSVELEREQKATEELAPAIPANALEKVSPSTAALVVEAKRRTKSEAQG